MAGGLGAWQSIGIAAGVLVLLGLLVFALLVWFLNHPK